MITIGALRRTDDLALRWLPTGRKHAYRIARCPDPNKPATATFNDARNDQAEPALPLRHAVNRTEALNAPMLAPSASAKTP